MMARKIPDTIKEYLHYDPFSGSLIWVKQPQMRKLRFEQAGCEKGRYGVIHFKGQNLLKHRVAFFLYYGEQPEVVDHINGETKDNRIENLRSSNQSANCINRKSHRSGRLPYTCCKKKWGRWQAKVSGKYIGYYKSEQEAYAAAMAYKDKRKVG